MITRTAVITTLLLAFAPTARADLAAISNQDAVAGLKGALEHGSSVAVDLLGRTDGFFGNGAVKIPLPDLLRKLREQQFERGLRPWTERFGLRAWSWLAAHAGLYALATRIGARMLSWMGGPERLLHKLPLAGGWTEGRDMPAPAGRTFRDLYAERQRSSTPKGK